MKMGIFGGIDMASAAELNRDNEPETNNHEEKTYIKTYSKAGRKPEKTGDTERQTSTNPKTPSHPGSRSTKVSSQ